MMALIQLAFHMFSFWGHPFGKIFEDDFPRVDKALFQEIILTLPTSLCHLNAFVASFFTTQSGWLGVALHDVEPSDELWVLDGCPMPVLLRKRADFEGRYRLCGAAHVPGAKDAQLAGQDPFQQERLDLVTIS
ncbi:hypothetical protein K458DRAFT_419977 [Lentithecium fluviatile CBS 122367]|uniref:Uncharacterized protein n=1 Tax=Lentithecium fluviatile CBS 122367 TaxID=1168545 RepID=A0A6G1IUV1_9PLEO|nr:hypothetical protein K458DRAFT_419977 [Lentithecium fluviatile CBS 122367]